MISDYLICWQWWEMRKNRPHPINLRCVVFCDAMWCVCVRALTYCVLHTGPCRVWFVYCIECVQRSLTHTNTNRVNKIEMARACVNTLDIVCCRLTLQSNAGSACNTQQRLSRFRRGRECAAGGEWDVVTLTLQPVVLSRRTLVASMWCCCFSCFHSARQYRDVRT